MVNVLTCVRGWLDASDCFCARVYVPALTSVLSVCMVCDGELSSECFCSDVGEDMATAANACWSGRAELGCSLDRSGDEHNT